MKSKILILFVFVFSIIFRSNLLSQNKWAYFGNTASSCLNYIEIGNVTISGYTLTVEASFNLTPNNANCTSTPYHDIVSKHYDISDVNYLLRPGNAEITTVNGFYKTEPVDISPEDCHHAAMVYDGKYLKFFLDSSFVDSVVVTGNIITNSLLTKIGYSAGQNPNWYTQYWGYIDEVRIWTVARTETQLKQFAFSNLKDVETHIGLIAYYDFQDGFTNMQGNSAFDGSLTGDVQIESVENDCITDDNGPDTDGDNLLITPNPVTDKLFINFGNSYTQVKSLMLFNVLGQVIYETDNIALNTEISMKNYITGIYFVTIIYNNKSVFTEKIVKLDTGN
jgi:hypothetical protein